MYSSSKNWFLETTLRFSKNDPWIDKPDRRHRPQGLYNTTIRNETLDFDIVCFLQIKIPDPRISACLFVSMCNEHCHFLNENPSFLIRRTNKSSFWVILMNLTAATAAAAVAAVAVPEEVRLSCLW